MNLRDFFKKNPDEESCIEGFKSKRLEMENSKLPFQYWMICIELMTLSKKSFSALEMQRIGYLKMVVMEDLKAKSINKEVEKAVNKTAFALTDGYKGYVKLMEKIRHHQVIVESNKTKSAKVFSWVNRTINNAKKMLLGTHHNCIN